MQKTLEIHMQEMREGLALELVKHTSDNSEHPGWCAFTDSVENRCDCIISELISIVSGAK